MLLFKRAASIKNLKSLKWKKKNGKRYIIQKNNGIPYFSLSSEMTENRLINLINNFWDLLEFGSPEGESYSRSLGSSN